MRISIKITPAELARLCLHGSLRLPIGRRKYIVKGYGVSALVGWQTKEGYRTFHKLTCSISGIEGTDFFLALAGYVDPMGQL